MRWLYSPARLPQAITVDTIDGAEGAASSNTGEGIDIWAQGAAVASAALSDSFDYVTMTGTSMATARVTGIAADPLAQGLPPEGLVTALHGAAKLVETGEFSGEVTRHVLVTTEGAPDALCNGTAVEALPPGFATPTKVVQP